MRMLLMNKWSFMQGILDFLSMSMSFPLVYHLCLVENIYGQLPSCFDWSPGKELSTFLVARIHGCSSTGDEQNQKKD